MPDSKIELSYEDGAGGYPGAVEFLLLLERLLLRGSRPTLCDITPTGPEPSAHDDDASPGIIIDLTSSGKTTGRSRRAVVLRPLFDGIPLEFNALAAFLHDACPSIALEDVVTGCVVAEGLPSLEASDGLTGNLEALFSRLITLIEGALLSPRRVIDRPLATARPLMDRSAAAFFLRNIAHASARQIYHLCCYSPHWRVGWRFNDGPGVLETGELAGGRWNVLPDMGSSFAADPFPIEWRGQTYIFFERLDYRDGKGKIFAQQFDATGPIGEASLVLEEKWHLSYPFLMEHQGELYMLPEASESGKVSIYRCIDFPNKWQCVGHLLSDIEAGDATIFKHSGRFWMTSVVRDGVAGFSDTLAVHHAPELLGPWEEHVRRPVLIDSRLARPAGAVVTHNGALWRPVQDCSAGYGKKLALMRIDTLDEENFVQTRVKMVSPGRFWPGNRLHILNRWGRLECIDGAIFTPKNLALRRATRSIIDRGLSATTQAGPPEVCRLGARPDSV